MLTVSSKLQQSRLVAGFAAGLFFLALISSEAFGQIPTAGRIVGNIDGISQDGEQFLVTARKASSS